MKKVAIFGTSGFASEVADICADLNVEKIIFLAPPGAASGSHDGIEIISEDHISELQKEGYVFSLGVSEPKLKKKIAQKFSHLNFVNLLHPTATFGRGQKEKLQPCRGLIVAAGARFMSGIVVEDFVAVSLNATVGHDTTLKSFVSIMPGANISGNVAMDESVYIGSGAVVLQGTEKQKLSLGAGVVVGAGAVVTKSFEGPGTIVGVPAQRIK